MNLPERLRSLLGESEHLGSCQLVIEKFEKWLMEGKLEFFPEYTDHGPTHFQSVLEGALELIPSETWEKLNPQDGAVLLGGVLLHDCAMHVSPDGFEALIQAAPPWSPPRSDRFGSFDDRPWHLLWSEYLNQARQWSDDFIRDVLGEGFHGPIIPPNLENLSELDRRVIGEFLRRHHARLGHEIAVYGVPGSDLNTLGLHKFNEELRDLMGFVARSHHLPIRACADRMPQGNRMSWRGVHAPFLMVVLRIADFLEIEAGRVPENTVSVRSLRCPLSRREWRKHLAVPIVKPHENDPEALQVETQVPDVATYLGLKKMFAAIQREMDESWATLGDVYRREPFGINLRRIASDIEETVKNAPFVPDRFEFKLRQNDVLKLLVGPLYGNDPSLGVRELLQNAVDAVRERQALEGTWPSEDGEPDVLLQLGELEADGYAKLTITDRGVGMTPETVRDFFLTAGASIRDSEDWKKTYETGESSEKYSRVLRTGRFGIGALAAFLLGEELEVVTRHHASGRGVRFEARMSQEPIELTWVDCPIGTTIMVHLSEQTRNLLISGTTRSLQWFHGNLPRVTIRVGTEETSVEPAIPSTGLNLPGWLKVAAPEFPRVLWRPNQRTSPVIYNGFIGMEAVRPRLTGWEIGSTELLIDDPDRVLEPDLMRSSIDLARAPFWEDFSADVFRTLIAYLLDRSPTEMSGSSIGFGNRVGLPESVMGGMTALCDEGVTLADWRCLWEIHPKSLMYVEEETQRPKDICDLHAESVAVLDLLHVRKMIGWHGPPALGVRVLHCYDHLLKVLNEIDGPQNRQSDAYYDDAYMISRMVERFEPDKISKDRTFRIMEFGDCVPTRMEEEYRQRPQSLIDSHPMIIEVFPDYSGDPPQKTLATKIWDEVIGAPVIPYNLERRRDKLSHAYASLERHIAATRLWFPE